MSRNANRCYRTRRPCSSRWDDTSPPDALRRVREDAIRRAREDLPAVPYPPVKPLPVYLVGDNEALYLEMDEEELRDLEESFRYADEAYYLACEAAYEAAEREAVNTVNDL